MATKCPNGAHYDETGICNCGVGHADPSALADDTARLSGEGSREDTVCRVCDKPLKSHTDAEFAACHPALPDPDATAAN